MITADQLLCHTIGDYILQSDWMANEKTKRSIAALVHVATYGLPFLFLRPSWTAYAVIVGTHFVIDRWRLARFVVLLKNVIGCPSVWSHVMRGKPRIHELPDYNTATGYAPETPAWLAVWLLIIADNIMHVTINGLALRYL